uniref:Uncharacterized protein n=1 Tax=Oryza glaberrima TaxID=4538 RepID=I1NKK8_ORYGL
MNAALLGPPAAFYPHVWGSGGEGPTRRLPTSVLASPPPPLAGAPPILGHPLCTSPTSIATACNSSRSCID